MMYPIKKYFLALLIFLKPIFCFELNFQNHFGYTAVDVSSAVEIDHAGGHELVDWNQFSYRGIIQSYFYKLGPLHLGGETGFHRLYFWEERFRTSRGENRWDWGTIWTWNAAGLLKHSPIPWFYYQVGAGIHTFLNGTGVTAGFSAAFGINTVNLGLISLPVEFRTDVIFGNSTPVEIGGGIGIHFNFSK